MYPTYKKTGIEWPKEAPPHWPPIRLKFAVRLNPSKGEIAKIDHFEEVSFLPMEAIGEDGSISLEHSRPIAEVETGYTYFRDGDVTIAKITPCFENGKGAVMQGLLGGIGFGTTELIVARPIDNKVCPEFLHSIFNSDAFRGLGQASMYGAGGQKRVPDDFVRNFRAPIPPLSEQQAIQNFIDSETAKIDALVEEQKRLIELLKEKRKAVISQAVTKGLEPNVPMKDSGVEWLGEVPAHWNVSPFKWQIERNDGGVWGDDPDGEQDTIVLRSTEQTVDGRWQMADPALRKLSESEKASALLSEGDLVVTKSSGSSLHIGKTTIVSKEIAELGCCYSNFMQRVRTKPGFMPKLAWYLMNNDIARLQFDLLSNSTTGLANLNGTMIGQVLVAVPPANEQQAIINFLDIEAYKIDSLNAKAISAIDLLQERRSALVSAAVTGQIDVRQLEAT
ncbi:MAG: hypothetical protein VW339_04940 [Quisquiliibacterium sp.]